jgi:HSP20 family protein
MPALARFDPARELTGVADINRVFGSLLGAGREGVTQSFVPAIDISENESSIVLRADLPGVSEDEVEVEVEDRVLTISGERRDEQRDQRDGYRRIERTFGRFSRSLTLPDGIDPEAVEAKFDHGVLELRIPKPEQRRPHRISIGPKSDTSKDNGGGGEDV